MIRISSEIKSVSGSQISVYDFLCDDCEKLLYRCPILGKKTVEVARINFNLCKDCYQKRTTEELSQIARMSSDMVIKDLAKMDKHSEILKNEGIIIKNRDPYLEDLLKYLELKRVNP